MEKSPYYEIASRYGIQIDYRPFIKVESITLKECRSQRVEILEHSVIVLSSRHNVDNFFRICEEARITVPETMKYICNTEAVALYLQKYIVYRKRKISFADGTFTGLMSLVTKNKNERFLLIMSEPHKPELPDAMQKLKLNFNKLILSRTVNADLSDVDIRSYGMLALFSPSEVTSLAEQFGTKDLPLLATFGAGTAQAAQQAGLEVAVAAPSPQAPSMAKAIDLFIAEGASGKQPAKAAKEQKPVVADGKPSRSKPAGSQAS